MADALPTAIQDLLTTQVFEFASAARRHFDTDDLVVILDMTAESPGLDAQPRVKVMGMQDGPLRDKLSKPASEVVRAMRSPLQSFWFIVLQGEGATCVAVNASMLAPGSGALN